MNWKWKKRLEQLFGAFPLSSLKRSRHALWLEIQLRKLPFSPNHTELFQLLFWESLWFFLLIIAVSSRWSNWPRKYAPLLHSRAFIVAGCNINRTYLVGLTGVGNVGPVFSKLTGIVCLILYCWLVNGWSYACRHIYFHFPKHQQLWFWWVRSAENSGRPRETDLGRSFVKIMDFFFTIKT